MILFYNHQLIINLINTRQLIVSMFQFNSDGSLKLSQGTIQKKQENIDRMKKGRCILIHKEMVSFSAPKKCILRIRLSDMFIDNAFMEKIHFYFKSQAEVPSKINGAFLSSG